MKAQWQDYSSKFLAITPREQYLILLTGLVGIVFVFYTLVIEQEQVEIDKLAKQITQTAANNRSAQTTINILQESLAKDPNVAIAKQISQYEHKLKEVDDALLLLTTDLINPIQMRYALTDLLKTQNKVSLLSFDVMAAKAIALPQQQEQGTENSVEEKNKSKDSLTLYKHGIKIKLKGSYFALRDYLNALEQLEWTFFWQEFDYQLRQYPKGELTIEMYSLSTKKEFIGV